MAGEKINVDINIAFIGAGNAGKTTIIQKALFDENNNTDQKESTMTVFDVYNNTLEIGQRKYNITLNDTPGQDIVGDLRRFALQTAQIPVLVMARNNRNSINTIQDHIQDMVQMFKQKNMKRTVEGLHPIFDPNYKKKTFFGSKSVVPKGAPDPKTMSPQEIAEISHMLQMIVVIVNKEEMFEKIDDRNNKTYSTAADIVQDREVSAMLQHIKGIIKKNGIPIVGNKIFVYHTSALGLMIDEHGKSYNHQWEGDAREIYKSIITNYNSFTSSPGSKFASESRKSYTI